MGVAAKNVVEGINHGWTTLQSTVSTHVQHSIRVLHIEVYLATNT